MKALKRRWGDVRLALALVSGILFAAQPALSGTPNVIPLPGFSCPPAKLWELDGTNRLAVCVDCRGAQPPPEIRSTACESNKVGLVEEGREFFCTSNTWRAGPWQVLSNTCRCSAGWIWNGTLCIPGPGPGPIDACRNLPGIQLVPPPGYYSAMPDCFRIRVNAFAEGLMWRNGAQPYWNGLMNQLNAQAPGWQLFPAPEDDIKQAVQYLENRWILGPCRGDPVQFGTIEVSCERGYEDIVSTPVQTGPFFLISLSIRSI